MVHHLYSPVYFQHELLFQIAANNTNNSNSSTASSSSLYFFERSKMNDADSSSFFSFQTFQKPSLTIFPSQSNLHKQPSSPMEPEPSSSMINGGGRKQQNHSNNDGFSGFKVFGGASDVLFFSYYVVIVAIGVAMNSFVIYTMRRLKRRDREQYRYGIGVCLFGMAISNLLSLWSLVIQSTLEFVVQNWSLPSGFITEVLCKITLFISHNAYTQAMWLWVLMSSMRYMATHRPLAYHSWRISHMAIGAILLFSFVLSSWLLFGHYHDITVQGHCVLVYDIPNRIRRFADVLFSFLLPMVTLIYMDGCVLFGRKIHSDPVLQIVVNRPNGEKKRIFHRFLLITVSSLLLNIPENTFRLLASFWPLEDSTTSPTTMEAVFKALYFLQFAFNAFYLTTFVYDRSVLSKTNSSRQLSISFRFRLEAETGGLFDFPYASSSRLHANSARGERERSHTLDPSFSRCGSPVADDDEQRRLHFHHHQNGNGGGGPRMGRRNASCCALYLLPPNERGTKKHSVGCQAKCIPIPMGAVQIAHPPQQPDAGRGLLALTTTTTTINDDLEMKRRDWV